MQDSLPVGQCLLTEEVCLILDLVSESPDELIVERTELGRRHPGRRHPGRRPGIRLCNHSTDNGRPVGLPRSYRSQSAASPSQKDEAVRRGIVWADLLCARKKKEKQEEGRKQSLTPGGRSLAVDILTACTLLNGGCMHHEDNDRVFFPAYSGEH